MEEAAPVFFRMTVRVLTRFGADAEVRGQVALELALLIADNLLQARVLAFLAQRSLDVYYVV